MLSLFSKWAGKRKRKYIDDYVGLIARTIINEAEAQMFHITIAVSLVRGGVVNSITLRKTGTQVRKVGERVEVEIIRDNLILTLRDIKTLVMKELESSSLSTNVANSFITDTIIKVLYENPAVSSGSLLDMLSSLLNENTIVKEKKNG